MKSLRIPSLLLLMLLMACGDNSPQKQPGDNVGSDDAHWPGDQDIIQKQELAINSVFPNKAPIEGGVTVDLIGQKFTDTMLVYFNSDAVTDIIVRSGSLATVVVPPGEYGYADIAVELGTQGAVLHNGFFYFLSLGVDEIVPEVVQSDKQETITILGSGFIEGSIVSIGSYEAESVNVVSENTLYVTLPVLPPGIYSVSIYNSHGEITAFDALTVFDPLQITAIEPKWVHLGSEGQAIIDGMGFIDGTSFWFGTVWTQPESLSTDGIQAELLIPPGTDEGPVSVMAQNSWGNSTNDINFFYIDPDNTSSRFLAVQPSAGPTSGGNQVHLIGAHLTGITSVVFGSSIATCQPQSENQLDCVVPPGDDGTVDVSINTSAGTLLLPAAYTYVAVEISSLYPPQGAIAGGTYVVIEGSGFLDGTQVLFNGNQAEIVVLTESLLAIYTPKGNVGPALVKVGRQGVYGEWMDLFEYFNPASRYQWTDGGRIDGSINVTVNDAYYNIPIPDAYVLIGLDPETGLHGFTDDRGQLTLSKPGLMGPVTITASMPMFSNHTYVNVDAQNIRFRLTPPPIVIDPPDDNTDSDTDSEPTDPVVDPPDPPVVRGTVDRLKDGSVIVGNTIWVFATTSYGGSVPSIQNGGVLVNGDDEYVITSRPGEVAIIAFAGDYESKYNTFVVKAMGVAPFLYLAQNQVYPDVDITIDTPFDTPLEIQLVDARLGEAGGPEISAITMDIDLGGMGFILFPRIIQDQAVLNLNMLSQLPHDMGQLKMNFRAGVYGAGLTQPYSEIRYYNVTDFSQPIIMEPILGTLQAAMPFEGGSLSSDYQFEVVSSNNSNATVHQHYFYDATAGLRWMVFTSGETLAFQLPMLDPETQGERFSNAAHNWYMQSFYVPEMSFNTLDNYRLSDWRSRAFTYSYFFVTH